MLDSWTDALMRGWRRMNKSALASLEFDGLDEDDWSNSTAQAASQKPFDHFDHFGDLLPHAAFWPVEQVFALESPEERASTFNPRRVEAMGFVLELFAPSSAGEDLQKALRGIYTLLPKNAGLQITLFGDPRIQEALANFERQRQGSYASAAKRRVNWYLKGALGELFDGTAYRLKSIRLILSLTIPVDGVDARADLDELITLRTTIMGTLATQQLHPRVWRANDWLEWMAFLCNPQAAMNSRSHARVHNPEHILRDQVMASDTVMRVRPKHIRFGEDKEEIVMRALSVQDYSEKFHLNQMADLIGDQFRTELQYTCPFMVTMGVMVLDYEAAKNIAVLKSTRATQVAESPMVKYLPDLVDRKRDWDMVASSFNKGEGIVHAYHQILLFDRADSIDRAERHAEQIWRSKAFTVLRDRYMQLQALQMSVPMMLTPSFQDDVRNTQRYTTKLVANVADTAPVIGEWAGFGSPMLMLWGRRGQAMGIDFFANPEGNYNVAMAAGSGAGKSVTGNEMIASVRGCGGKAYVIDAGRSYERPCRLHGGQFIEFSPDSSPNFNPFPMIEDMTDEEALADAVVMIAQIVNSMAAPDRLLSDYEQGVVEQCVQEEIMAKGRAGSITGIYDRLLAFRDAQTNDLVQIAGQLAQSMRSYTEHGVYGRHFRGESPIEFSSDFIVLELDGLSSSPRLQSTVLMIVMFKITQAMYVDRSVRKIVLIDEAWAMMREGATAKFIETGYRRARKYNGQFVTITQSFADYFRTTAARAAYDNSDWKVSLRQPEESWEATFKDGQFVATPWQQQFLRSLRTEAGKFSEMFIKMPQGWGVGRLILDPHALLEYSTKAEDYNAVKAYLDRGMGVHESIEAVLKDRRVMV
jgi:conjugal transfer ATP-binding protein TraC